MADGRVIDGLETASRAAHVYGRQIWAAGIFPWSFRARAAHPQVEIEAIFKLKSDAAGAKL